MEKNTINQLKLHMESFIAKNSQLTKDNITDIAKKILNQTVLTSKNKQYRICEIEFYLRCADHMDEYTHCNDDQYGYWYFHKFPNGSYKGGTFKGLDITLGNNKDKYCGILIRSIYDIENKKMICGPSNSVTELIGQHNCTNVKEFMKNKDTLFVLNASKSNKTTNNYIYLNDHKFNKEIIYSGPRIGLSDKHMEWKTINYRFVVHPIQLL